MSPLSLQCATSSSSIPSNSNPHMNFPLEQTTATSTSLSFSTFSYSPVLVSFKFLRSGNRVSPKNRFHANSADSDQQLSQEETVSNSSTQSFLSLLCPLLKLFSARDPSQDRNYALEVATSSVSTLARFPWGSRSLSKDFDNQEIATKDSPKHLQLFEFEACPFCRRVREAMTELDLSAEIYPCPKGSLRHRKMVREFGGKEQFPFLIDPNTGISMYESGDIVKYLFQQYGEGRNPSMGLLESTLVTGWMPTILRAGRGMTKWEKAKLDPPSKKLELFSYENSPYARIVREALCELELPYILHNAGEGSRRKNMLLHLSGSQEVPFLIDPNTDSRIGDYEKILHYLFSTFSVVAA